METSHGVYGDKRQTRAHENADIVDETADTRIAPEPQAHETQCVLQRVVVAEMQHAEEPSEGIDREPIRRQFDAVLCLVRLQPNRS